MYRQRHLGSVGQLPYAFRQAAHVGSEASSTAPRQGKRGRRNRRIRTNIGYSVLFRELFEQLLPNAEPPEPVLDNRARELLGRFLDFMWSETPSEQSESESEMVDMRMRMPDELFLQLLGEGEQESSPEGAGESSSSTAKDVLNKIHELWRWMDPKLLLRFCTTHITSYIYFTYI